MNFDPNPFKLGDMIAMENWAEIRRLDKAEDLAIKETARGLDISHNTVRRALVGDEPPKYQHQRKLRHQQLANSGLDVPRMSPTLVAERTGWGSSITMLKIKVRQLRPLYTSVDPANR